MKHIMRLLIVFLIPLYIIAFTACTPHPQNVKVINCLPPIYPDYTNINIPQNIAPLNFTLRNNADAMEIKATCGDAVLVVNGTGKDVCFDLSEWKKFISKASGKVVNVEISARVNNRWIKYKAFVWRVMQEKIDPYITYRLIEPDYEVFNKLEIRERCVENFDEDALCDYHIVGNRCMNCHIMGNQSPNLSMMYVRGKNGGAIFNHNGKLRKLDINRKDMVSPSVYAGFNHTGRYLVFSSNIIIPAFHSKGSKRLEVYDRKSDVYVADLENNRILSCSQLSDSASLETFPTFSPDGKYIYFCTAKAVKLPQDIKKLKYSLCRIPFCEETGKFANRVDTIINARLTGKSVCHPRISPNGKYLIYTVAEYGTFPIWHRETDLQMVNLVIRKIDNLKEVNSNCSDTYHSWSSNSHWLVFASKRDDGLYGKPYFCYIDDKGKAHKPFVMPQKNPDFYDLNLKSFNIPEFCRGKMPFNTFDIERVMSLNAERFK